MPHHGHTHTLHIVLTGAVLGLSPGGARPTVPFAQHLSRLFMHLGVSSFPLLLARHPSLECLLSTQEVSWCQPSARKGQNGICNLNKS